VAAGCSELAGNKAQLCIKRETSNQKRTTRT